MTATFQTIYQSVVFNSWRQVLLEMHRQASMDHWGNISDLHSFTVQKRHQDALTHLVYPVAVEWLRRSGCSFEQLHTTLLLYRGSALRFPECAEAKEWLKESKRIIRILFSEIRRQLISQPDWPRFYSRSADPRCRDALLTHLAREVLVWSYACCSKETESLNGDSLGWEYVLNGMMTLSASYLNMTRGHCRPPKSFDEIKSNFPGPDGDWDADNLLVTETSDEKYDWDFEHEDASFTKSESIPIEISIESGTPEWDVESDTEIIYRTIERAAELENLTPQGNQGGNAWPFSERLRATFACTGYTRMREKTPEGTAGEIRKLLVTALLQHGFSLKNDRLLGNSLEWLYSMRTQERAIYGETLGKKLRENLTAVLNEAESSVELDVASIVNRTESLSKKIPQSSVAHWYFTQFSPFIATEPSLRKRILFLTGSELKNSLHRDFQAAVQARESGLGDFFVSHLSEIQDGLELLCERWKQHDENNPDRTKRLAKFFTQPTRSRNQGAKTRYTYSMEQWRQIAAGLVHMDRHPALFLYHKIWQKLSTIPTDRISPAAQLLDRLRPNLIPIPGLPSPENCSLDHLPCIRHWLTGGENHG